MEMLVGNSTKIIIKMNGVSIVRNGCGIIGKLKFSICYKKAKLFVMYSEIVR